MPVTPVYGLPFPSLSDPPDGPDQIGDLALATETALQTQVAALQSSISTLANPPRAQMRQIVAQTISDVTWTSITFTAEDIDSHNGHSTAVNTSRYVAQVNGVYLLGGGMWWAANSTGVRIGRWAKNGSLLVGSGVEVPTIVGGQVGVAYKPYLVTLNVSDYVELQGWQNSGGNLDTYVGGGADEAQSSMMVTLVRNNNF